MPFLTKLSNMQTPIPTIPQIADMLRHHVNYDNDAPRLIAEEVLPILKIDLTYDEVYELEDQKSRIDDLVDGKKELEEMLRHAEASAEVKSNKLEEIIASIERGEIDTETLKYRLFALV